MAQGKYAKWLEEENQSLLEGWTRAGLTDEQVAHNIGIGTTTLYRWKNEHEEIRDALKRGKEVSDFQVENALFKRALGYEYEEVKTYIEETDGKKKKRIEKTKKHVAADVTAQIFWLKNRKPIDWRDKKETELSGGVEVNNPYEGLTTEELRKLARSEKYE